MVKPKFKAGDKVRNIYGNISPVRTIKGHLRYDEDRKLHLYQLVLEPDFSEGFELQENCWEFAHKEMNMGIIKEFLGVQDES